MTKRRAFDGFAGLRPFLVRCACGWNAEREDDVLHRVHGLLSREENRPADR